MELVERIQLDNTIADINLQNHLSEIKVKGVLNLTRQPFWKRNRCKYKITAKWGHEYFIIPEKKWEKLIDELLFETVSATGYFDYEQDRLQLTSLSRFYSPVDSSKIEIDYEEKRHSLVLEHMNELNYLAAA